MGSYGLNKKHHYYLSSLGPQKHRIASREQRERGEGRDEDRQKDGKEFENKSKKEKDDFAFELRLDNKWNRLLSKTAQLY